MYILHPFMDEVLSEIIVKKDNKMGGNIPGGNFLGGNFPRTDIYICSNQLQFINKKIIMKCLAIKALA